MRMNSKRIGLLVVGLLGASATSAWATSLAPGDAQFANQPSVSGAPKYIEGLPAYFELANIVAVLTSPNTGALGGTTVSTVYKNPVTNWLTFDYTVTAAPTNGRVIVRGALDGQWVGVTIFNVGANGSGVSGLGDPSPEWSNGDPNYIERDPATEAPAIQWRTGAAQGSIGTVIGPGNSSSHAWFETNAVEFNQSVIGYLDSGSTGLAAILAPAGVVPEPATLILLGTGLIGFVSRRRK